MNLIDELRTHPRIGEQEKRYNILNGRLPEYVKKALSLRFQDQKHYDSALAHLDTSVDVYSYIVRLLSDVYRRPPHRKFADETDTQIWNEVVDSHFDLILDEVSRIAFACGLCFVRPLVDDNKLTSEIIPPHIIACKWKTPTRLEECVYWLDSKTYIHWTETTSQIFNSDDTPISSAVPHSYGKPPLVVFRTIYPMTGEYWNWQQRQDLVEAAILSCIWASYVSRIAWYQSHLQIVNRPVSRGGDEVGFNFGGTAEKVYVGPTEVLEGNYDTLNLQADIRQYLDYIEQRLRRVAATYGLAPELLHGNNFRSAQERLVSHTTLAEHRAALIKWFRPADVELMDLARMVWNRESTSSLFGDSKPIVNYGEVQLVENPLDRLKFAEQRMRLGLDSPVDVLLAEDPDISTRDEALEIIHRNLSETKQVIEGPTATPLGHPRFYPTFQSADTDDKPEVKK